MLRWVSDTTLDKDTANHVLADLNSESQSDLPGGANEESTQTGNKAI